MHKNEQERKAREQEAADKLAAEQERKAREQEAADKLAAEQAALAASQPVEQPTVQVTTSLLNQQNSERVNNLVNTLNKSEGNALSVKPIEQTLPLSGSIRQVITEDMTTISVSRLNELLDIERKYNALIAHGVDNWIGYEDALDDI
jgi:hypothetical protein